MDVLTVIKTLFPCFPTGTRERGSIQLPTDTSRFQSVSEDNPVHSSSLDGKKLKMSSEEAASAIVTAMLAADKASPSLDAVILSIIREAGWKESLMAKILAALEAVLKKEVPLSEPM